MPNPEFVLWLSAWIAVMLFVLWGQRKDGSGAGLVISYVLQLWVIHWLAAAIYALPWYMPADLWMLYGLQQSTYAIAGFAVGSTIVVPFIFKSTTQTAVEDKGRAAADPWLVHTYLAIGIVTFFLIEPILHPIPTLSAIASATSNLLLVALGMECWNGLRSEGRHHRSFWRWVVLIATLPFATIVTKGFLSYGFAAMLTVLSFIGSFYRPRWKMVACSLLVGYFALSTYVTYMRDRQEIRDVVWRQEAYSTRLSTILNTFASFEFLDLTNVDHLRRIDDRLNQNALVGMAVANLEAYPDRFANGRTIWEAVLSPIPRVFWPDKKSFAGSGDLVSEFTGLRFGADTSVGIGHVMEWYVNFGSYGVFFGMLALGVLIGWLDRQAIVRLRRGDWSNFAVWWLPGLSLLQVGGSLVEAVSGAAAALVVALLIRQYGGMKRQPGAFEAPALALVGPRPIAERRMRRSTATRSRSVTEP